MSRFRLFGSVIAARLALVLLLAPLLGLLAAVAAETVPDARIAENLVRGREASTLGTRAYSRSPLGTTWIHHSECKLLSLGLGDAREANTLTSVLEARTAQTCRILNEQLIEFQNNGTLATGKPYTRYWHGYSSFTRPSLALFGVAGTRWLAFGVLMAAMGALFVEVRNSGGTVAGWLLVAPALLTTDAIIGGLSILQALAITTAWLGGWLAYRLVKREPTWLVAGLAGALAGAIASYVDLLTTMPGALTMTVVGATLGAGIVASHAVVSSWRIPLAATVGWFIGAAGMWASKWVIAMPVLGASRVFNEVRAQVAIRLSGDHAEVDQSRIVGLTDNLSFWWDRPLTPLVVILSFSILILVLGRRWTTLDRSSALSIAVVAAIIATPHISWYVLLNNHSQLHVGLTYRSLGLAFGALVAWVFTVIRQPGHDPRGSAQGASSCAPPGGPG